MIETNFLHQYESLGNNDNARFQKASKIFREGTCPIIARKAIEAYINHLLENEQPVRMRTCVAACCCGIPNLITKILRATTYVLCIPCAIPLACAREKKYLIEDEVSRSFKRVVHEWVDVGITSSSITANLLGTIYPPLMDGFVQNVFDYYMIRIAEREMHEKNLKNRIQAYEHYWKKLTDAIKNQTEIPKKNETMNAYLDQLESQKKSNSLIIEEKSDQFEGE